jgi:hypothetical protein
LDLLDHIALFLLFDLDQLELLLVGLSGGRQRGGFAMDIFLDVFKTPFVLLVNFL